MSTTRQAQIQELRDDGSTPRAQHRKLGWQKCSPVLDELIGDGIVGVVIRSAFA